MYFCKKKILPLTYLFNQKSWFIFLSCLLELVSFFRTELAYLHSLKFFFNICRVNLKDKLLFLYLLILFSEVLMTYQSRDNLPRILSLRPLEACIHVILLLPLKKVLNSVCMCVCMCAYMQVGMYVLYLSAMPTAARRGHQVPCSRHYK